MVSSSKESTSWLCLGLYGEEKMKKINKKKYAEFVVVVVSFNSLHSTLLYIQWNLVSLSNVDKDHMTTVTLCRILWVLQWSRLDCRREEWNGWRAKGYYNGNVERGCSDNDSTYRKG